MIPCAHTSFASWWHEGYLWQNEDVLQECVTTTTSMACCSTPALNCILWQPCRNDLPAGLSAMSILCLHICAWCQSCFYIHLHPIIKAGLKVSRHTRFYNVTKILEGWVENRPTLWHFAQDLCPRRLTYRWSPKRWEPKTFQMYG